MILYNTSKVIFGLMIAVLFVGCNSQTHRNSNDGTTWGAGPFDSNGKRIYFTATSERGTAITYTGGPSTGMMMMGGKLACVSCHGTDARGGTHTMHMKTMKSPDITWSALVGMHEKEHESGKSEGRNHQGYDLETFRRAVVNGEHPDGDCGRKTHWL